MEAKSQSCELFGHLKKSKFRKCRHSNISEDGLTFLAGSIWEAPCHALCFGFFSMNLSRNAPSERSVSGLPLYTMLTPERRVLAIAATDGCTCWASTVSSHQPTRSALLLLRKVSKPKTQLVNVEVVTSYTKQGQLLLKDANCTFQRINLESS